MTTPGPPAGDVPEDDAPAGRTPDAPADGPWPGGHPGDEQVDALLDADLREVRDRRPDDGGVPPEAQTAAHVLGCARCRGVLADMRGVRALLRADGAAAPPPPADLAARIAAAVADEQARARAARRGRRWRTAFALAAGLVVVGGAGSLVIGELRAGSEVAAGALGEDGDGDAAAGSAADEPAGGPTWLASGTDYRAGRVGDQLDAVLRGLPVAEALSGDTTSGATTTGAAGAEQGAPEAGPQPVTPDEPRRGGGAQAALGAAPHLSAADPAALDACLTALGAAGDVVAVDAAAWEGEPADVVLVADAAAPTGVRVWVVRAGCPGGADALLHYELVGG